MVSWSKGTWLATLSHSSVAIRSAMALILMVWLVSHARFSRMKSRVVREAASCILPTSRIASMAGAVQSSWLSKALRILSSSSSVHEAPLTGSATSLMTGRSAYSDT